MANSKKEIYKKYEKEYKMTSKVVESINKANIIANDIIHIRVINFESEYIVEVQTNKETITLDELS